MLLLSFNYLCHFFAFHELSCCAHFSRFHYHHCCNNVVLVITSTCTFTAEVVAYQSNGKGQEAVHLDLLQKQTLVQKAVPTLQSPSVSLWIVLWNRPMAMRVCVLACCSWHGRRGQWSPCRHFHRLLLKGVMLIAWNISVIWMGG